MAFDRIEPPDLWPSTIARLLFALVCSWSSGPLRPKFSDFLPETLRGGEWLTEEEAIVKAFGHSPQ